MCVVSIQATPRFGFQHQKGTDLIKYVCVEKVVVNDVVGGLVFVAAWRAFITLAVGGIIDGA